MTIIYFISLILFLLIAALLCGVILVQESKAGGLGAAFGGEEVTSVFGTGAADILKKFTAYLAGIFFISCVLLSLWTNAVGRQQVAAPATIEDISE
jgi:preprotein translocase subunit SecG